MTRLEQLNNHAPKQLIRELFDIKDRIDGTIKMLIGVDKIENDDYDLVKSHANMFTTIVYHLPFDDEHKMSVIMDILNTSHEEFKKLDLPYICTECKHHYSMHYAFQCFYKTCKCTKDYGTNGKPLTSYDNQRFVNANKLPIKDE